jgi:hypothetical protein
LPGKFRAIGCRIEAVPFDAWFYGDRHRQKAYSPGGELSVKLDNCCNRIGGDRLRSGPVRLHGRGEEWLPVDEVKVLAKKKPPAGSGDRLLVSHTANAVEKSLKAGAKGGGDGGSLFESFFR